MDSIMAQIRGLLAEGKSSREIISLGYSPRTVYKVQEVFRRKSRFLGDHPGVQGSEHRLASLETIRPESAVVPSKSTDDALRVEMERLKAQVSAMESDNEELKAEIKTSACPGCGQHVAWGQSKTERRLKPAWFPPILECLAEWEFVTTCSRCGFEWVRPESSSS